MSDPIRYALIGTGGIAQSYASAFEDFAEARLAAVVDVRSEAAEAMAERFGCPYFLSTDQLLQQAENIDAAIIMTPPNTHEEIALACMSQGIHVLCEKPFTLDVDSAQRMAEKAHQENVVLTMASKFRFVEDVIKTKSIISSGILGEIILLENAFTSRIDMKNRWNSNPEVSGGGVLIDNGTHSVDILRYILGPLTDVHALEGKRVQGLNVEDTVRLFVHSHSGVMGSVDLSWSINKELDWFINVYGSHGTIQIGWKESRYKQQGSREWVTFGSGYDKIKAFRGILSNFTRAITGQEPLRITVEDAVASVEVIEAAYQSLRQAPWKDVSYCSQQSILTTPPPIVSIR